MKKKKRTLRRRIRTRLSLLFLLLLFASAAYLETKGQNGHTAAGTASLSETEEADNISVRKPDAEGDSNPIRKPEVVEDAVVPDANDLASDNSALSVTFLDVGEGDATLINADGHYMLIDGGGQSTSSRLIAYLKAQEITSLDTVLITHYDADHLSGIVGVLHVFPVRQIISPDYERDGRIFTSFQNMLQETGIIPVHPSVGDTFELGQVLFTVLCPTAYDSAIPNNNSIGIRLENGSHTFLFLGDAQEEIETEMLESGLLSPCTVYKVSHHGSNTSTSQAFLDTITPQYAVVSCGLDNSYTHPAPSVMKRLQEAQILLFRTDLQGSITAFSNGTDLTWDKEPCLDYSPGK